MNKLVVILGPTSTGKTSLAVKLCRKFDGEIVSADSRQVYKYMDIGTGKIPTSLIGKARIKKGVDKWEINGVPIRLYDIVSPSGRFSVHEYAKRANEEIKRIQDRGKIPFLVGGTGFFIDVVLGNATLSGVEPNFRLRANLEKLESEELFAMLKKLDPKRAEYIDWNNKVRLVRAIEVAMGSKREKVGEDVVFYNPLVVGLTAPKKKLYEKVDKWVMGAVNEGLVPETKNLISKGYRGSFPMKGIIYKSVVEYLDGKIEFPDMLERIKYDLHGYIRRQMTWFGRNSQVLWFDVTKKGFDKEIEGQVQSYLDGS